jgi:hypothetical protein
VQASALESVAASHRRQQLVIASADQAAEELGVRAVPDLYRAAGELLAC